MSDEPKHPEIKITDRRHFDTSGGRRPDAEVPPEPSADPGKSPEPAPAGQDAAARPPSSPLPADPAGPGSVPAQGPPAGAAREPTEPALPGELGDLASGLSSSFSLLIARLAQETEIYLGLVPYPGKETAEPDLDAARAMIDMLNMLQEKTRGNLVAEEVRLLENLLYAYRLEFVRLRSGGGAR